MKAEWHREDLAPSRTPAELTATVTATAATNGYRQRPVTAHNARTIHANWGYVRPEKRTVGDQRRSTEQPACATTDGVPVACL